MKKLIPIIFMVFLVGCGTKYRPLTTVNAQAQTNNTEYPLPTATPSVIPSATIDYLATSVSANETTVSSVATSNEAMRLNAVVTSEHEARELQKTQIAHDEIMMQGQIELASINATASIAPTAIMLTSTQQVITNTQTPEYAAFLSARETATEHVPTQIVSAAKAEIYEKHGERNYVIEMFVKFAIGVFALSMCWKIFIQPNQQIQKKQDILTEEEQSEDNSTQPENEKQYKNLNNGEHKPIPCTAEQLAIFADAITQGVKSMAIDQWKNRIDDGLGKTDIIHLRDWASNNTDNAGRDFVKVTSDKQLVATDEFLNFLLEYLDRGVLPVGYEFEKQITPPTPEVVPAQFVGNAL